MIYPADPLGPEGREAAQKALASGLAVAVPTDTVYVLAVDPFVPGASDRLFELDAIRRREWEAENGGKPEREQRYVPGVFADVLHRGQQPEQATQVRQLQLAQGALEVRVQRAGEGDHQVHGGGLSAVRSSRIVASFFSTGRLTKPSWGRLLQAPFRPWPKKTSTTSRA